MEGLTLAGRTALVTGGAGGLGSAIVEELAALGARVLVADLDSDGAQRVAAKLADAAAYAVDLSDPAAIDDLVARVDAPVDVLVNNAGWDKVEPFPQSEPATWDKVNGSTSGRRCS